MVSSHPYNCLYPWKTREEFVDSICKSLVYKGDGLIAINKPFAIAVDNPLKNSPEIKGKSKAVSQTVLTSGIPEFPYSISDILPLLKTQLKLDFLTIVKSPERFTSGILLMAYTEPAANAIAQALEKAKTKHIPPFSYWALTTCIPLASQNLQKVGLKLVEVKDFEMKVPIIVPKISRNAILKKAVKSVLVKMETISSNQLTNTALVEVATNSIAKHFLRVFLAHKFAPILGDGMYSSRVKLVLGKPVEVSPFNKAAYDPQSLSAHLCNKLQLPKSKCQNIPTHLHLHQVTLVGFKQKEDLILNAPAPEHFMWSLNQVDLSINELVTLKELRLTN